MTLPNPRKPLWVVVATCSMMEATIIAERLKYFGIPTYVHRESLGAIFGLSIGLGTVEVVVPEKFQAAAEAILYPDEAIARLEDGLEENYGDNDSQ
ncbi:MAG: hypothetical protein OHK0023_11760 [Anaerolineae bacterium]